MLRRLAKFAATSGALRRAALEKSAALASLAGKALKVHHAYSTVQGARGAYKQNRTGFRPEVHQELLGATPKPPGTL